MTNLGILVGAGLALVLAAGCAGTAQDVSAKAPAISTSAAAPTGVRSGMPMIKLPDGAVPVAGTQVDASSMPAQYPRLVWTLANGSTIGLYGLQGACQTASAEVSSQTDSQVVIRLIEQTSTKQKACPMYLKYQALSVRLDKPLGKRTVVLQNSIERG